MVCTASAVATSPAAATVARTVLPHRRRRQTRSALLGRGMRADASIWPSSLIAAHRCCSSTAHLPASTRAAEMNCGEVLRALVNGGTTLLLTTRYLEEADQLADDIVIIDKGEIIAHGTPTAAQGARPAPTSNSRCPTPPTSTPRRHCCQGRQGGVHRPQRRRLTTSRRPRRPHAGRRVARLDNKISVDDLGLARPAWTTCSLALTGHRAEDDEKEHRHSRIRPKTTSAHRD